MSFTAVVAGLGAMGGGMARALLDSPDFKTVVGYDLAQPLVDAFFEDAKAVHKAPTCKPTTLQEAIVPDTQFVVIVLQTELQCEQVCFGSNNNTPCLLELLARPNNNNNNSSCCVILCSTVSASWTRQASQQFTSRGIGFVDAPISGGPVRAREGTLTILASSDNEKDELLLPSGRSRPVLDALAQPEQLYIIKGGAGMGSTVKMVHQLLAGVHIAAAAEALALAAKAGLDVQQFYEIVNGAAGTSWMFQDRGQRMIQQQHDDKKEQRQVKSMLNIFVKDLDIVYSEAKKLQSPIPLASAALQQFISGQGLGLGHCDDSELVKVYETITGVPVMAMGQTRIRNAQTTEKEEKGEGNDNVGDEWILDNGVAETILEVGSEPRHQVVLSNEYIRAILVRFPPGDTTLAHRHDQDSLYFFLVQQEERGGGSFDLINHVKGSAPICDCVEFGEIRYGAHKTDSKPLIHKITNKSKTSHMLCVDAEVLQKPPVTSILPLMSDKHQLVKERDKCRVYKLTLEPGESVVVTYPFFYLSVVLQPSTVEKEITAGPIQWTETSELGDVSWKEPVHNMKKTNVGKTAFVEYIAEWC